MNRHRRDRVVDFHTECDVRAPNDLHRVRVRVDGVQKKEAFHALRAAVVVPLARDVFRDIEVAVRQGQNDRVALQRVVS